MQYAAAVCSMHAMQLSWKKLLLLLLCTVVLSVLLEKLCATVQYSMLLETHANESHDRPTDGYNLA